MAYDTNIFFVLNYRDFWNRAATTGHQRKAPLLFDMQAANERTQKCDHMPKKSKGNISQAKQEIQI